MTAAAGEAGALSAYAESPIAVADRARVDALVKASGTSFYWAMRLLPAGKRRAMFAVYAFCREVDDIADEPGEEAAKRAALAGWREEIDALYAGHPGRPVSRALVEPVTEFGLRRGDFEALIAGMEMDAGNRVRLRDSAELQLYCDRVACAVGRLSVRIFGMEEALGLELARVQGEALQLTNILRDIAEDSARDRLYLPADRLRAHGIDPEEPLDTLLSRPAIATICAEIAALAADRFAAVDALAARSDRRCVRPALIMAAVYRRTFERLVRRGWQRWSEPVRVSKAEKLWVALRRSLA